MLVGKRAAPPPLLGLRSSTGRSRDPLPQLESCLPQASLDRAVTEKTLLSTETMTFFFPGQLIFLKENVWPVEGGSRARLPSGSCAKMGWTPLGDSSRDLLLVANRQQWPFFVCCFF